MKEGVIKYLAKDSNCQLDGSRQQKIQKMTTLGRNCLRIKQDGKAIAERKPY